VFLFGVAEPSAELWKAVRGYVERGGGVAIVPAGQEMNLAAYQIADAKAVLPATWKQIARIDEKHYGALWDLEDASVFQHPLLKPLRRWMDYPTTDFVVQKPSVHAYWLVEPAEKAATLVSYAEKGNPPALLERLGTAGKVVQLTTPLDERTDKWNNYIESKTSFYVALTKLLTSYLTGEDKEPQLNFESGVDVPRVALPPATRYPSYTLRGGDLLETIVAEKSAAELRLKEASLPGNYEVQGVPGSGQPEVVGRFSVNLPATEVDLSRAAAGDVEAVLGQGSIVSADRRASIQELLAGHWNEPLELFPHLMVLLLFVLAVENLLANKFYRREDAERA